MRLTACIATSTCCRRCDRSSRQGGNPCRLTTPAANVLDAISRHQSNRHRAYTSRPTRHPADDGWTSSYLRVSFERTKGGRRRRGPQRGGASTAAISLTASAPTTKAKNLILVGLGVGGHGRCRKARPAGVARTGPQCAVDLAPRAAAVRAAPAPTSPESERGSLVRLRLPRSLR